MVNQFLAPPAPPPNCFQGSHWPDLYQKYMLFHWEARIPTKQGFAATTHLSDAKNPCISTSILYMRTNIVQQYLKYIYIYGTDKACMCMHHVCISFASSSCLWLMYQVQYPVAFKWVRACHIGYVNLGLHSCMKEEMQPFLHLIIV